jgi:hypothetical protein
MSWSPLILDGGTAHKAAPVTIAASPSRKARGKARLVITVRTAGLEGLTWWKPGAAVQVQLGAGEHEGMLRITPEGPFKLSGTSKGATGGGSAMLSLTGFPCALEAKMKPAAVEYDWSDGWIEVTLPAWACAPKPAAPVTSLRTAPSPQMLARDVPIDPAALTRRGQAPIPAAKRTGSAR